MDKAAQVAYRNAAVAIRQNPVDRACAQFWEPPRTRYDDETIDDFCRRYHPSAVDAKQLQEQAAQFRDQACTPEYQARQLLPQLPTAASVKSFKIGRIPQKPIAAILSPWEFFI
jgi:hypothetical protein